VANKILLLGFGNPANGDDALGTMIAEIFEKDNMPGLTVDADYQLTVEDSAKAAENDIVIFADASLNCREPFSFEPVKAKETGSFSSHSVEPCEVMALAQKLFDSNAKGYILAIRGYNFEQLNEGLTEKAKANLEKAAQFLREIFETKNFENIDTFSCA
jgi:hydrogenase maturation protease